MAYAMLCFYFYYDIYNEIVAIPMFLLAKQKRLCNTRNVLLMYIISESIEALTYYVRGVCSLSVL